MENVTSDILIQDLKDNLINNRIGGTVAEADMIVTPSSSGIYAALFPIYKSTLSGLLLLSFLLSYMK